ncbi:MAG: uracil phosphoribosyltransferase [Deltaproteobacteria bacterium]|nr:uracil phosphoribosyltransferase [Deltaproteobacteria bacterium]
MRDHVYDQVPFRTSEITHKYGHNVHVLADPLALTQLARLCAKGTYQPEINRLVSELYGILVRAIINAEFPRHPVAQPTRMIDATPHGVFHGEVIDPQLRAVTVNIARAGTLPSQITYDLLNSVLDPRLVRQDHFVMARETNEAGKVIGSKISGSKIGGDVDDSILLFPDPMGATGGSIVMALDTYKAVPGKPRKVICAHLIVTPEYLKRVTTAHPNAVIYALRLDRGLSPEEVFDTVPGTHWDKERGLDDKQYIVPGGGGFGELMNNAYV